MQQMIIANELRSGEVVFLSEEGNWVNNIDKATVALDIDQANKLLTLAQEAEHNNKVVGAELVEIEAQDKQRFPKDIREAIRVNGPTV
ncbi:MAG: DUF2849 domain-containing protein [Gammaproteobacteria bacterium]|nr:hypothetical protein [Gammaproteobacteria bacterium]MCH2668879.1 DUF2849 domain-containing protein [Gammaproteobacteria bacterium]|tara:strand:- start:59 stop:322 length:264 start_codon:yes stop_codon:yes gene_type:complete